MRQRTQVLNHLIFNQILKQTNFFNSSTKSPASKLIVHNQSVLDFFPLKNNP